MAPRGGLAALASELESASSREAVAKCLKVRRRAVLGDLTGCSGADTRPAPQACCEALQVLEQGADCPPSLDAALAQRKLLRHKDAVRARASVCRGAAPRPARRALSRLAVPPLPGFVGGPPAARRLPGGAAPRPRAGGAV
jgi:hypothetical protein